MNVSGRIELIGRSWLFESRAGCLQLDVYNWMIDTGWKNLDVNSMYESRCTKLVLRNCMFGTGFTKLESTITGLQETG